MALTVQQQTTYWGVATAVFCVVLWFLGDVILPFVLGGAIAYCLDPVADRLQKMGLSRILSVTVITLVAFLTFILLVLLVIPTLVAQIGGLIEAAPGAPDKIRAFFAANFPALLDEQSTMYQQLVKIGSTNCCRANMPTPFAASPTRSTKRWRHSSVAKAPCA